MSFGTRVNHILMSSFAVALLAACGGDNSKSKLATITVNPEKPIVITADATISGDKKITGPWFQFTASMGNGTAEKITIVAVQAEVYGQSSTGMTDKRVVAFTPGEFNFTLSEDKECKFSSFGTFTEGAPTTVLTLSNSDPLCTRIPIFAIGSNPTGPNGTNFRYRVKLKPLGWFGTEDQATDRFDKSVTFFTQ